MPPQIDSADPVDPNPYRRQAEQRRRRALAFAPLLQADQHLSHESAAVLWEAPLPLVLGDGGSPTSRTSRNAEDPRPRGEGLPERPSGQMALTSRGMPGPNVVDTAPFWM